MTPPTAPACATISTLSILPRGHLCAIQYAEQHTGCEIFNLGTGRGVSASWRWSTPFPKSTTSPSPYVIGPRRAGDLATVYADPAKAKNVLGWEAKKTVADMLPRQLELAE